MLHKTHIAHGRNLMLKLMQIIYFVIICANHKNYELQQGTDYTDEQTIKTITITGKLWYSIKTMC